MRRGIFGRLRHDTRAECRMAGENARRPPRRRRRTSQAARSGGAGESVQGARFTTLRPRLPLAKPYGSPYSTHIPVGHWPLSGAL